MRNVEIQVLPLGRIKAIYYTLAKGVYEKDYIIIVNSQLKKSKQKLILARELLLHYLGFQSDIL